MTVATDRRMTLKENPLNPQIAMFLAFAFGSLGTPPHRLAIGHQIEVKSRYVTSRQPDLVVHSEASEAAIVGDGKLLRLGMPLPILVVEVVSNIDTDPKSRDRDYINKRNEYLERGILEYWIVDPIEGVVLVLNLQNEDYSSQLFVGEMAIVSSAFPALNITAKQVLSARL